MLLEHVYRLPIHILVETMKSQLEPIVFRTELSNPPFCEIPCIATIEMRKTQMFHCRIWNVEGVLLLDQQQAFEVLCLCEDLHWQMLPQNSSLAHPYPAPALSQNPVLTPEGEPVPHRICELSSETLAALTSLQKNIFFLANGHTSMQRIADLLRKPLSEIWNAAFQLHLSHCLAW